MPLGSISHYAQYDALLTVRRARSVVTHSHPSPLQLPTLHLQVRRVRRKYNVSEIASPLMSICLVMSVLTAGPSVPGTPGIPGFPTGPCTPGGPLFPWGPMDPWRKRTILLQFHHRLNASLLFSLFFHINDCSNCSHVLTHWLRCRKYLRQGSMDNACYIQNQSVINGLGFLLSPFVCVTIIFIGCKWTCRFSNVRFHSTIGILIFRQL